VRYTPFVKSPGKRPSPLPTDSPLRNRCGIVSTNLLTAREKLQSYDPGFTTLLLTLQRVPDVFEEAFRPYRFRVARSPQCLICQDGGSVTPQTTEELDVALDQALARLGDA